MADAAGQGALGNSRLVLEFIDKLESHWRRLIDDAISDARAFERTNAKRKRLVEEMKTQLTQTLPMMIESSRVNLSQSGFQNREMPVSVSNRIADLEPYLHMKLRQFRRKVGDPVEAESGFRRMVRDIGVAVTAAAVIAAAGWLVSRLT